MTNAERPIDPPEGDSFDIGSHNPEPVESDAPTGEQELHAAMHTHRIPEHMHYALARYFLSHAKVGGFLTAVLENNFTRAVCSADADNRMAFRGYATFLHNEVPGKAWGSREAVKEWLKGDPT